MPKMDPIRGVPVITTFELFDSIAKSEGKGQTAGDVMAEMYDDMNTELRAEEQRILHDPNEALSSIRRYMEEDCTDDEQREHFGFCYNNVILIEMISAKVSSTFREDGTSFIAKLLLDDGSTRTVKYTDWHTSGSFYEPPDGGTELQVIKINDNNVIDAFTTGCESKYDESTSVPKCEVCHHFGGAALHGKYNSAVYLCPASMNQGKSVTRWVFACKVHSIRWFVNSGWVGPMIRLRQIPPSL